MNLFFHVFCVESWATRFFTVWVCVICSWRFLTDQQALYFSHIRSQSPGITSFLPSIILFPSPSQSPHLFHSIYCLSNDTFTFPSFLPSFSSRGEREKRVVRVESEERWHIPLGEPRQVRTYVCSYDDSHWCRVVVTDLYRWLLDLLTSIRVWVVSSHAAFHCSDSPYLIICLFISSRHKWQNPSLP